MQTLHDRFSGRIRLELLGRGRLQLRAAAAAVVATRAPLRLVAVPDLRRVAVGMWLERYMILVTSLYRDFLVSSWGAYHADVLGLVDLSRHHWPVLRAVPAVIRVSADDLDLRDRGASAQELRHARSAIRRSPFQVAFYFVQRACSGRRPPPPGRRHAGLRRVLRRPERRRGPCSGSPRPPPPPTAGSRASGR